MHRLAGILAVLPLLMVSACSNDPADTPPPPAAVELSLALALDFEVSTRVEAGDGYSAIADWLRNQDGVTAADATELALRYVLSDDTERWWYDASGPTVSTSSLASRRDGLVLRTNGDESNEAKRALVLAPFRFQFGDDLGPWRNELEKQRDYAPGSVDYAEDFAVGDSEFSDWDAYRLILISTHGTLVRDAKGVNNTALFSSRYCGLTAFIKREIAAGRGAIATKAANRSLQSLFGVSSSVVLAALPDDLLQRANDFIRQESAGLRATGKVCSVLQLPLAGRPAAGGNAPRGPLEVIAYTSAWFATQPRLTRTVLFLGACDGSSFPPRFDATAPYADLGWNQPVSNAGSIRAQNIFLKELVTRGRTVGQSLAEVQTAGAASVTWVNARGRTTIAGLENNGDDNIRIREVVSFTRPDDTRPLSALGESLQAAQVTPQRRSLVDIGIRVEGLTAGNRDQAEVWVVDSQDIEIWRAGQLPALDDDGGAQITARLDLPIDVSRGSQGVELTARMKLPEDGESVHAILVTIDPAPGGQWSVRLDGRVLAGSFVTAPSAGAVTRPDGTSAWALTLTQIDEPLLPTVTLNVLNHSGRNMDCTGETGSFELEVGVAERLMSATTYFAPAGGMDCDVQANINITSFSQSTGLTAALSGTVCELSGDPDGNTVLRVIPFSGELVFPEAGCGPPAPANGFVGSFTVLDSAGICTDVYDNARIATGFNQTCSMSPELMCQSTKCPTTGLIGTCDLRDESVQITFRGHLQSYTAAFGASRTDLEQYCMLQNGVWTNL